MILETAARKRRALELLEAGATIGVICADPGVNCRRHKIRVWKEADPHFRVRWNELMRELGRDVRPMGETDE